MVSGSILGDVIQDSVCLVRLTILNFQKDSQECKFLFLFFHRVGQCAPLAHHSYSFGFANNYLMSQLLHQLGFSEHGWMAVTNYSYSLNFRVAETVVMENGFVPCRREVVLKKIGEYSDIALCPQKQGILLLGPRKSTKMTKMAGVTPAKWAFAKSTVLTTLIILVDLSDHYSYRIRPFWTN